MDRKNIIQQLEKVLEEFKKYSLTLQNVSTNTIKMRTVCEKIKNSWSGSCFGYHSRLYYGNFEKPPRDEQFSVEWGGINGFSQYWQERTTDEVKKAINQLIGNSFSVDKFEKENEKLASEIEDLQTQVELLVSATTTKESNHPLSDIEKIEPKKKLKSYLRAYMSGSMMTRDSEAVAQGIFTPAIVYYEGVVYDAEYMVANIEKYLKSVKHFIKWYELQTKSFKSTASKPLLTDLSLLHREIYSKCQRLFETGEYAEAVKKSFKVVRDRLRELTGYETGSEAFGKGKLHIKGAAALNVDKDFNDAAKFLTMAIDMFRNEKSHTSNAEIDDSQQAEEYLTLSSLAMHLLDRAEILTI